LRRDGLCFGAASTIFERSLKIGVAGAARSTREGPAPAGGTVTVSCSLAWRGALALAVLTLGSACGASGDPPSGASLPALRIDPERVTVSGLSSGGAMAVQYHVAHSSTVHGVGVLAAPPYFCAEGAVAAALGRCMKDGATIPVDRLLAALEGFATAGRVDASTNMNDDRVWLYRGAADPHVDRGVADALERFYRARVDPAGIARVELEHAAHTFPTRNAEASPCSLSEPPYVSDCGFDGAADMFRHLYGEPTAPGSGPGRLLPFAQASYAAAGGSASLADEGWYYVPAACLAADSCGLHVVLHGCKQGAGEVGDAFVRRSGYLAVADAHRVVLLFPQVKPTLSPLNPLGCWDWWGYEGAAYPTREGGQVRALHAMVEAVLGARP
jgi:poly(3-hydroxybutyrate) depolymerase